VKGIHLYTDSFVKDNRKYTCMFPQRQCNIQLKDTNDIFSTKKKKQSRSFRTYWKAGSEFTIKITIVALIFTYENIRYGKTNLGSSVVVRHKKRYIW